MTNANKREKNESNIYDLVILGYYTFTPVTPRAEPESYYREDIL